jgi:flagellar biosynthesis protein FlhG
MTIGTETATHTASAGALAVTGSKGGVGKSNLVANLAVSLARWGRQVMLVDGDLGLSNLDVLLGLIPTYNVEHLVRGEATLEDVLIDGPAGIHVLPAASGIPDLASLDDAARERLISLLAEGTATMDHLLIDTGAGLGSTTLSMQLAASRILLVTTPEPTSMVDAYASMKVIWAADPAKPIDLVVNEVADEDEALCVHEQLTNATEQFLAREPGYLGAVYSDPNVPEAVRRQTCLMEYAPDSPAGRCIERIALRLSLESGDSPASEDYWHRLMPMATEVPH